MEDYPANRVLAKGNSTENSDHKRKTLCTRTQKNYLVIYAFFCLLAILDDTFLSPACKIYWIVSDTYIDTVFAALCTIAVLGNAILSIVIGSFNHKIYGLTLKEILALRPGRIGIPHVAVISLCIVILAIFFYALDYCTTITVLTICLTIYLAIKSIELWKLLSNDETAAEILHEITSSGKQTPEFFLSRWYSELESAIRVNDSAAQEKYVTSIRQLYDSQNRTDKKGDLGIDPAIDRMSADIFPLACQHLGFVDAYQDILCLGSEDVRGFDTILIATDYYKQIRFCNEQNIGRYKIPETIKDILNRTTLDESTKRLFVLGFYRALKDNQIISRPAKDSILGPVFEDLCLLNDTDGGKRKVDILLNIAKYDIFENEDIEDRKHLWKLLFKYIYDVNRFSKSPYYVSLIAQLFRALFFYSQLEVEMLNGEYREELATLFLYGDAGKNRQEITLAGLVSEKQDSIVTWLATDTISNPELAGSLFDYYSASFLFKDAIWTLENRLTFAFAYYLTNGYHYTVFPLFKEPKDHENDSELREKLCRQICGFYEVNGRLTQTMQNKVKLLQRFMGRDSVLPDDIVSENFEYFNTIICALNKDRNSMLEKQPIAQLTEYNEMLIEACSSLRGFKCSDTLELNHAPIITITQNVHQRGVNNDQSSAHAMVMIVRELINRRIQNVLQTVDLSFDQQGVNTLLGILKNRQYKVRNYTFVNDWGIPAEVRQTDEYSELSNIIHEIELLDNPDLQDYIFLRESILFNIEVLSRKIEAPSDEQCEKYLMQCKIADGKYQIEGAIRNYTEARDYVMRYYIVEYIELSFTTNIDEKSGFRIKFIRK